MDAFGFAQERQICLAFRGPWLSFWALGIVRAHEIKTRFWNSSSSDWIDLCSRRPLPSTRFLCRSGYYTVRLAGRV